MMLTWVTNNPKAARALRAADIAYERAKFMAIGLPLARKVEAIRAAKAVRQAAYDAIQKETTA